MCSKSLQEEEEDMDNYQGDLTDILRASGADWKFLGADFDIHEPTSLPLTFGNPFCHARDPLLHAPASLLSPTFFGPSDEIMTPSATVSEKLRISTDGEHAAVINASSSISNSQISSPRNQGVKRRKKQATKVVCIPAVNSRPTGEIVPSDLWAWRKYGQKPIKGSPHPRGYYRCSSSKGCPARKQVERSRSEPNMLVITYTSDHNHPWPTQRNALAGSTRSKQHTVKEETHRSEPVTMMPTSSHGEDSFFAELGEIEAGLLFTKGFTHQINGSDQHSTLFHCSPKN